LGGIGVRRWRPLTRENGRASPLCGPDEILGFGEMPRYDDDAGEPCEAEPPDEPAP